MITILQEFLIVSIIIFSINMIYFLLKNKSKRYKNIPTVEINYISKIYGIDVSMIGLNRIQKDISIVNSIIMTIDLLALYHAKTLIIGIVLVVIATFSLIPICYHILGKAYQKMIYRG